MADPRLPHYSSPRHPERYPEYADSGAEWLGDIPAHWEVRRLSAVGRITKCSGGTKAHDVPQGIPCVRYGDLYTHHDSSITRSRAFVSAEHAAAYSTIRYGDLLFAASGETIDEIGKSSVNLMHGEALCGGDIILLRPAIPVEARFLGYTTNAPYMTHQKSRLGRGMTILHIYGQQLKNATMLLPPVPEQHAIADFLDREIAEIDALVEKQQELMRLLGEKRTALIGHTVTKGLDPDVAMKDSGVEWLGEIPAHWEIQRLRTLASITTGGRDTVNRRHDGKYPFFVRSPVVERIDTWSFDGEAVLTAGDGVGVAKVFHYANGRFDFHQRVYKFSDFDKVAGRFFFRYFGALLRFETLQGTAKSTVDSLRLPMLQNFQVVVPPLSEQHAIIAFLDHETTQIDAMIAKLNQAIERLNEYRSALIAAAVTGKIDVRHHGDQMVSDNTQTTQARP